MKKLSFFLAMFLLIGQMLWAQSGDPSKLEIGVGGTFAKPKIIPSLTALGLAQVTVNYKLTSTAKVVSKEKSTGAIAGAKLTAFLETTDGALTEADFQEITDHFYDYFAQQLNANGITTVAWDKITGTEFYKASAEKLADPGGDTGGNKWVTSTAHKGNILYGGGIAFTFGRIKKASAFCEDIGAPTAYIHVTVDFADVFLDVDIKTSGQYSYSIPTTRTWKYNSAVNPSVKVIPSTLGSSLFWNEKMQSESLYPVGDIPSDMAYIDNISQDQSRMKNSMWAFSKEMVPVVIETTRDKYKAAAKKALEHYVDAFIAKQKQPK